jgi:hypothetical protein
LSASTGSRATLRLDGGYNVCLKVTDTVAGRTMIVEPTCMDPSWASGSTSDNTPVIGGSDLPGIVPGQGTGSSSVDLSSSGRDLKSVIRRWIFDRLASSRKGQDFRTLPQNAHPGVERANVFSVARALLRPAHRLAAASAFNARKEGVWRQVRTSSGPF